MVLRAFVDRSEGQESKDGTIWLTLAISLVDKDALDHSNTIFVGLPVEEVILMSMELEEGGRDTLAL